MVKSYVAETKLSPQHISQLEQRGSTFLSRSDLEQDGGKLFKLDFNKLADLNRYKRNLQQGKKFLLKAQQVKDIVDVQDGGSVWKKVLGGLKMIGTKMGEKFEVADGVSVNPFTLGYDLGHDHIAPALKKMKGGKVSIGKKVARAVRATNKAAAPVAKRAKKKAAEIYRDHKDEVAAIGRQVADAAISGEGDLKAVSKAAANQLAHLAAKDQLEKAGVYDDENQYRFGQYAPQDGGKVSVGKKVARAFRKAAPVAKKAGRAARKVYRDNKEEIDAVTRNLADAAVSSALKEEGADFRGAARDAASRVGHITARDQLTKAGIYNSDNPYAYGQYRPPLPADEYAQDEVEGAGFVKSLKKIGKKAIGKAVSAAVDNAMDRAMDGAMSSSMSGGSLAASGLSYGLGGKRLAHSFQSGGGMRPVGSSFKPLGAGYGLGGTRLAQVGSSFRAL